MAGSSKPVLLCLRPARAYRNGVKRPLANWLVLAVCLAPLSCSAPTSSPGQNAERSAALSGSADIVPAYVVLQGPPAADLLPSSGPVSAQARSAVKGRLRRLAAEHAAVRPEIEATGAVITADLTRLANVIQVRVDRAHLRDLAALPEVVRIDPVTILHRNLGRAVPLIGAPEAWQLSTPIRGNGIRIGIVDTGIDYTHADFGGPGTTAAYQQNDPTKIEPGSFPTARVVGGWDFVGDNYDATNASTAIPAPDPDPLDCDHATSQGQEVSGGHGTHVSGIAAGNGVLKDGSAYTGPYNASLDPSAFTVFPGVAPEASLYALKIFGCTGSTDQLAAALEWASDPKKLGFSDHLDVVNASLGTSYGLGSETEGNIIKNLTKVGTLLVVAAGNDGSAGAPFYAAGSPGVYPQTLSVAASASSNLQTLTVDSPASIQGQVAASEASFAQRLSSTGPITGTLVYAEPHDACAPLTNAAAISGHIALMDRGTCPFVDKFNNAVAAGAIAGVVVDNVDAVEPMSMGGGKQGSVPIPGVLIRKADGAPIKANIGQGVTVTLQTGYTGTGSETIASFSSRGPSSSGNLLKPEVSAPGQGIKSAGVGSGSGSRNMSGTSMASPVAAGAAALVRQARPDLSPVEVKAALMNTAKNIEDLAGNSFPTSMQGAGRIRVDAAVSGHATALENSTDGSVGLSFGAVITDKNYSDTRQITLKNHGTTPIDYQASVVASYPLPGVTLDVQPASFTLAGGATTNVTVTLHVDPKALGAPGPDPETPPVLDFGNSTSEPRQFLNEASGNVLFTAQSQGTETLHVPYEAVVRGAGDRHAAPLTGCAPDKGATLQIPIIGDSAYPDPVVSAFELGDTHQPTAGESDADALLDLVAIGAATDTATQDAANASVYFGLAIAGQWTTPALGQFSRVAVLIDTNFDQQPDYEITVEPLTRTGPYADVLAANTYNVSTQQAVNNSQRFVNMVPPDTLRTAPFDNSVLVLSTYLHSIGLDASNAHFQYAGLTQSETLFPKGQQTKWVDYDALHPWIDTAQGGQGGQPIYKSGDPVVVHVGKTATQALPKVLLLHHMNVQGKRWEVVDLAKETGSLESGDLQLSATGPDKALPGSQLSLSAKLVNSGKTDRAGVKLGGSLNGAELISATPSRGSCSVSPKISCDFGTMKAGESISVQFNVKTAATGADKAELGLQATSTHACESNLANNQAKVNVALSTPPAPPAPVYVPTGGCSGCHIGTTTQGRAGAAFASLLLLVGLGWRRRRQPGQR